MVDLGLVLVRKIGHLLDLCLKRHVHRPSRDPITLADGQCRIDPIAAHYIARDRGNRLECLAFDVLDCTVCVQKGVTVAKFVMDELVRTRGVLPVNKRFGVPRLDPMAVVHDPEQRLICVFCGFEAEQESAVAGEIVMRIAIGDDFGHERLAACLKGGKAVGLLDAVRLDPDCIADVPQHGGVHAGEVVLIGESGGTRKAGDQNVFDVFAAVRFVTRKPKPPHTESVGDRTHDFGKREVRGGDIDKLGELHMVDGQVA